MMQLGCTQLAKRIIAYSSKKRFVAGFFAAFRYRVSLFSLVPWLVLSIMINAQAYGSEAKADIEAGHKKSIVCVSCHNPQMYQTADDYPKLAGQNGRYTYQQLKAFQSGERDNVTMQAIAAGLSDQDMLDLAAYYASLEPLIGQADPKLVERGQSIYRGGVGKKGIPACIACHGPKGRGIASAAYPALGGQNATYTYNQLVAYRDKTRGNTNDHSSTIMWDIAAKMSPDEMKAVASYIAGLH